jgi:hypothetical protein
VTSKSKASRGKPALDEDSAVRPAEPEARAIDMKIKSAEGEEVNITGNNDLLKKMQDERWEIYAWIDENVSILCPIRFKRVQLTRVNSYLGPGIMEQVRRIHV